MTNASPAEAVPALPEQDALRSRQWALLARLLAAAPDADTLAALAALEGDETALGQAYGVLARMAAETDAATVEREFFELFIGVGRGELLPYASFYLTGFLNERPLADLRRDLGAMGVVRADGRHEPEDHVASIAEVMAGLAAGEFDAGVSGLWRGRRGGLLRPTHAALGHAVFRRSGDRAERSVLPRRGGDRPDLHGYRDTRVRASGRGGSRHGRGADREQTLRKRSDGGPDTPRHGTKGGRHG